MASEPVYLLDTKILLRLSKRTDSNHALVKGALDALTARGADICCTPQNVSEFWNVCTRPSVHNGFGLSITETDEHLRAIERTIRVLPDSEHIYRMWRILVVRHHVSGVRCTMPAWRQPCRSTVSVIFSRFLTLNQPDFIRYTSISVVHPRNVPV